MRIRVLPSGGATQRELPDTSHTGQTCGNRKRRRRGDKMKILLPSILLFKLGELQIIDAWSSSPTCTLNTQQQQQQKKSISMFLNNQLFPKGTLLTSTPTDRRPVDVDDDFDVDRQGRVLGFDIFESPATRSNVDMETWRNDFTLDSNSGLIWNSNGQTAAPQTPVKVFSDILPQWFPWLPTKAQIQSLKVTELKEACHQRGLVKVRTKEYREARRRKIQFVDIVLTLIRLFRSKIGNKADLQDRLWQWTCDQQQQHQAKIHGDFLTNLFEDSTTIEQYSDSSTSRTIEHDEETKAPKSLEEWSRNAIEFGHLQEKRKAIHRQKRQGRPVKKPVKPVESQKEYLFKLTKALQKPSSPYASNVKVKELYMASKTADQLGERKMAIQLLETLLRVTPNDARVYRRLSRMYNEQGNQNQARAILQMGIRRQPENPWLWHGMAQLEQSHGGNKEQARKFYQKAIQVDPTFAHSYHALGTFEHTQGNIAQAMKILKKGIEFCPTNHRLHHALGDLYRGAKLLEDAERSYRRSLEHGDHINFCFVYSALAAVAYERNQMDTARKWLHRSLQLNNGRHAQGWVSLAQLEETFGDVEKARSVCKTAIANYERGLIESRQRYKKKPLRKHGKDSSSPDDDSSKSDFSSNALDVQTQLLKSVPKYRSGDKFLNVYRNWARLEEKYGTFETVDEVYERASIAFPLSYKVLMDWASYHATMRNYDRARTLYIQACQRASNRYSDPYRVYAELEMSLGNYGQARKILFRGAQAASKSADGGLGNQEGLARLFHTWAICEWHVGNLSRAEVLFDNALRLTDSGDDGSELRSFILYSIARLEYYRGELHLAQHCVGLCMKEDRMPGGKSRVWKLWKSIAKAMGNEILEDQCRQQAYDALKEEKNQDSLSSLKGVSLRRDPWQVKLFGLENNFKGNSEFFANVKFPTQQSTKVQAGIPSFFL